ncbi:hypothetical protein ACFQ22_02565 [Lentilactobacillus raoultii]|uniref:Uncharacterized protein n=1 Tax=Lentilactobacillus raoultii TaxID=1987503 RepID=A0ABW3PLQ6_9LACO|nr:hypothetical protein [Lentilactobacillus raoultii]
MSVYLYIGLVIGIPAILAVGLVLFGKQVVKSRDEKDTYFRRLRILGPIIIVLYVLIFWLSVRLV